MKAETLLRLLKKCVLCLFLCVAAKDGVGQQVDSSLISLAVTSKIEGLAHFYDPARKGINISGDSSIIRYIPSYYLNDTSQNSLYLLRLRTKVVGKLVYIDFASVSSAEISGDYQTGIIREYIVNTDSLTSGTTRYQAGAALLPAEEDSFWGDTLQPILVTAGAAAVIALFFFVKF